MNNLLKTYIKELEDIDTVEQFGDFLFRFNKMMREEDFEAEMPGGK